jgi:hypothetical protein
VSVSESCGSYHNAQRSTCRHVNSALFSCHSKTNTSFLDPGLFKKVVLPFNLPAKARQAGHLDFICNLDFEIWDLPRRLQKAGGAR